MTGAAKAPGADPSAIEALEASIKDKEGRLENLHEYNRQRTQDAWDERRSTRARNKDGGDTPEETPVRTGGSGGAETPTGTGDRSAEAKRSYRTDIARLLSMSDEEFAAEWKRYSELRATGGAYEK